MVRALARRSALHCGLGAIRACGNGFYTYQEYVDCLGHTWYPCIPGELKKYDRNEWAVMVATVMQSFGLIMMTLADVDANRFLGRNRTRLLVVVLGWLVNNIFQIASPPLTPVPSRIFFLLPTLPLLYILLRFNQITRVEARFPLLTQVLGLALAMFCSCMISRKSMISRFPSARGLLLPAASLDQLGRRPCASLIGIHAISSRVIRWRSSPPLTSTISSTGFFGRFWLLSPPPNFIQQQ